ncbi:hypothetical protein FISHEDRAFT_68358 [Fistulina hepatica ATCC 64428]|uniref:Ams2/SPT21 N-terminal domain-containing protein n=1 Tax=Fistulina hepatica ATCC 64428 TaxID=1128425 RepID=A0A0D7ARL8_9AGAR|nr:hypothetical protein FISHEDRAFT_68358 [Fistulina hepatica ATCC 64428]
MAPSLTLPLRVLFTFDSGSYILARSSSAVLVVDAGASGDKRFGAANFKTCLATVARSCPEFFHDQAKDYTVYVLDPSEVDAIQPGSTSRGMAVGMGLMSGALNAPDDDDATATGIIRDFHGKQSLQVVLAFRELLRPAAPGSSSNSANNKSKPATRSNKKQARHRLSHPRPPEASSPVVPVQQPVASTSALQQPASSSDQLQAYALLSLLADSSQSSPNNMLLRAMSSIDASQRSQTCSSSASAPDPHVTLATLLQYIVSSSAQLATPGAPAPSANVQAAATATDAAPGGGQVVVTQSEDVGDDEVVILDKENVNPSAFSRRSSEKEIPSFAASASRSSDKPADNAFADTSTSSRGMKRPFDQFVESQTTENDKRPLFARSLQRSVSAHPMMRHSSPPPARGNANSNVPSTTAASSPPRVRRSYVVPGWARTKTALQPRLSKEAEKAIQEAEQRKRREALDKKRARRKSSKANLRSALLSEAGDQHIDLSSAPPPRRPSDSTKAVEKTSAPGVDLPVFASSDDLDIALPSPSTSKTATPPRTPPRTPTQRRTIRSPLVSLFTPEGGGPFAASWPLSPSTPRRPSSSEKQVVKMEQCDLWEGHDFLSDELEAAPEDDPPSSTLGSSSDISGSPCPRRIMLAPSSPLPPSSPPRWSESPMDDSDADPPSDMGGILDSELGEAYSRSSPLGAFNSLEQSAVSPFDGTGATFDSSADFFDLFTNQEVDANSPAFGEFAQNGLTGLDLSEFWESVKPLMASGEQGSTSKDTAGTDATVKGLDSNVKDQHPVLGDAEAAGMADRVHKLYSGCLV